MNTYTSTPKGIVKIGDHIKVSYKCSAKSGVVTKVTKSRIEYNVYSQSYNTFTKTNQFESVAVRKVYDINPKDAILVS